MHPRLGFWLVLGACLAGCSAYSKPDYERIQGQWTATEIRNDGADVPLDGKGLEFAHGKLSNFKNGAVEGPYGIYRLDENKRPKWLDIHDEKRNRDIQGIYDLDGDTLKICLNDQATSVRPGEFKSEPGSLNAVMILRRVK